MANNRQLSNTRKRERGQLGGVLVEGVVSLWMIVMAGVLLVMLILNVGMMILNSEKINTVACEAAKNIDAQKFWLGMPRDDYKADEATDNARELADRMLDNFGLPKTTDFKVVETETRIGGRLVSLIKVELQVSGLRTVGGFFPPFVKLSGSGMTCPNAVPPYATMVMTIVDPKTNGANNQAVVFPVYGALKHSFASGYSDNTSPYAHAKGYKGATTVLFHGVTAWQNDPGYPANPQGYQIGRQGGASYKW